MKSSDDYVIKKAPREIKPSEHVILSLISVIVTCVVAYFTMPM